MTSNLYPTYAEAKKAVKALGITTRLVYVQAKSLGVDPRLPYSPENTYRRSWRRNGSWPGFLGRERRRVRKPFRSWRAAAKAVRALGIRTQKEYRRRRREHPRLPSVPSVFFKKDWKKNGGWPGFFGRAPLRRDAGIYPTWEEAAAAARALGIRSAESYAPAYKADPRLPSNPEVRYGEEWDRRGGWSGFLRGKPRPYKTLKLAMVAVRWLKIASQADYRTRHGLDPRLPGRPDQFYAKEWETVGGWRGFLGLAPAREPFPSYEEAAAAAREVGFASGKAYLRGYKAHPRLPGNPWVKYAAVWKKRGGWDGFLRSFRVPRPLQLSPAIRNALATILPAE